MNKKLLVLLLVFFGLVSLGLAVYYWVTPADHLLRFMPGYAPDVTKIHFKHGLGMLILAISSWILAWFQSAKKPSSLIH